MAEALEHILHSRNSTRFESVRMNKRLCFYLALIFAVPSPAYAQYEVPQAPADAQHTAVSEVARDSAEGLIKLDVMVADASGKPVPDLKRADFNLLEDGDAQNIISFQAFDGREAASPISTTGGKELDRRRNGRRR